MKVKITENLVKIVEVDAKNEREALQLVDDKYRAADEDYILSAENFSDVQFEVVKNDWFVR